MMTVGRGLVTSLVAREMQVGDKGGERGRIVVSLAMIT